MEKSNFLVDTSLQGFKRLRSHASIEVGTLAIDTEPVVGENGKNSLLEISVVDPDSMKDVFTTRVRQEDGFKLPEYKIKDLGYSEEELKYSPSLDEVCEILKRIVRGNILIGYNITYDLKWFPQLKQYAYAVRDVMHRYSSSYGPWNPDWGNRSWVSLQDAAKATGFVLEENELFHRAKTDARACAHVWNYCEEKDLPKAEIQNDLILRKSAEAMLQKVVNNPAPF